jgi:hypothetical protein
VIAVRIVGGLGNQMFQYACGRALAQRMRTHVYFDLSAFNNYRVHNYGLHGFRGEVAKAPWHLTTGSRLWAVARRLHLSPASYFALLGIRWVDEGDDLSYRPQQLALQSSAYLSGYWQCAHYFNDCESSIRENFRLIPALDEMLTERRQRLDIGQGVTVSVHVRRGDYVTDTAANATHGTIDQDYYRRSVENLAAMLESDFRLLVFSDDTVWARENIHLPAPTVHVVADDHFPQIDMHLMASCDHHIIANSSFSWWGAWLNPSPSKTVVAPARWFKNTALKADDICPAEWVRI